MKQLIKGLFSQILILIVLFSTSCSEQKNEKSLKIIDVAGSVGGGRITDISEVAKEIRYIPLETSEMSLVSDRPRVIYENGRIYINDRTDSIKIFDNDGKLVGKFCRRGRGPEEYPHSENIYVVPKNGNILINTRNESLSIFKYDKEGEFIGKFSMPRNAKFSIDSPYWLNDNSYMSAIQTYTDKPESSVVIYDSLGKVSLLLPIPKLPSYQIFEEVKPIGLLDRNGKIVYEKLESDIKRVRNPDAPKFYRFKDKIRVVYDSNDTVLSIGANLQVDTPYIFNYGKYRDYSMDRSSIRGTKGKHIILTGRNGESIFETDGFLLMQFALRDYAHEPYYKSTADGKGTYAPNNSYAIFKKESGKFSFLNQTEKGVLGFRENLMGGPPFWPTYVSNDNSLVMIISAASLIEYASNHKVSAKLAEIVKNLNENDNPVVVIAR